MQYVLRAQRKLANQPNQTLRRIIMLTIKDLAVSKSLDRKEMSAVCGGFSGKGGNNEVFQLVKQDAFGVGNTNMNFNVQPNTTTSVDASSVTHSISQSLANVGGIQKGLLL